MSNGKEMSLVCHRIITLKFVFVFLILHLQGNYMVRREHMNLL